MMQIHPYLAFDGQCEAAFNFYEKCLGGKITFKMTNGESPMAAQMPPEAHGRIMHMALEVGNQVVAGADAPPGHFKKPQGFCVSINTDDAATAERTFNALAENGHVDMPMQETFWALRFGMLTDQFGIPWMVNCSRPA